MSLKIIGSGLGRTGTSSLKVALEQLGYGKTYHMQELLKEPSGLKYFQQAEKGENVDWDSLFTGYQSAIDYPTARYYKQLIAKYPEAKVIHTVRDPESWYKSCTETIFWASKPDASRMFNMMIRMPFNKELRERLPVLKFNGGLMEKEFGKDLKNKEAVMKVLTDRKEEVMRIVPKEKLLIYDVKEGWEPLCKFLNVPVPSTPFPRVNTKDEFIGNVKGMVKGKPMMQHT